MQEPGVGGHPMGGGVNCDVDGSEIRWGRVRREPQVRYGLTRAPPRHVGTRIGGTPCGSRNFFGQLLISSLMTLTLVSLVSLLDIGK